MKTRFLTIALLTFILVGIGCRKRVVHLSTTDAVPEYVTHKDELERLSKWFDAPLHGEFGNSRYRYYVILVYDGSGAVVTSGWVYQYLELKPDIWVKIMEFNRLPYWIKRINETHDGLDFVDQDGERLLFIKYGA